MEIYLIIASILAGLYLFFIIYLLVGWVKLNKIAATNRKNKSPFVSIILPVRNESQNIKATLSAIFAQNYPAHLFEVIVIDDYSTDGTLRLAKEFENDNLLLLDLMKYFGNPGEYTPNKKKAITIGIKNAKGDVIVTTDGDCVMHETWLTTLVEFYKNNDFRFITGPVLLQPAKGIFGLFQQMDVMAMLGVTGASIANKNSTMANGANLLYEKSAFLEVDGYRGNVEMPTGDDVFLMQKIERLNPEKIGFIKDLNACVYTAPVKGLGEFVSQRVRWTSKSTSFQKKGTTLLLIFVYLINLFVLLFIPIAFLKFELAWLPLAILFGVKLLVDFIFLIPVAGFFKKRILLLGLPMFECFHILYVVIIGVLGLSGKYTWKDRNIK